MIPQPRPRPVECPADVVSLLLVEDDPSIAEPLVEGLQYAGFTVRWVSTGREALDGLDGADATDLILLDLGLPDLDGAEVCRRLRARTVAPIIVVSARDDELDRVLMLEIGADDYVVKPFGLRELVARVRAVLRRAGATVAGAVPARSELGSRPGGAAEEEPVPGLRIDRRRRVVLVGGREVELTAKEFDLLAFLADDPGAVRRRAEILAAVWDENWWGSTKTLDVHVASLRRKLGDPAWISTARGVGYRLSAPR